MLERETHRERNSELGEEFQRQLLRRVEDSIKDRMARRLEDYFQEHISPQDMDQVAEKAFSMILEGKSMTEASELIQRLSLALVRGGR